jgi:DNA mismatch endonuclease (patch repair protein)
MVTQKGVVCISDVFSPEKRSEVMSKIRSKNTKIELIVRKWLHYFGYRYRIHDKRLPGSHDIVLPKYKTAIFIHGCFWHLHNGCKIAKLPKTRVDYWMEKLNRNAERDKSKVKSLEEMGWNVIIVWECEIRHKPEDRLIALLEQIRGVDYTYYKN